LKDPNNGISVDGSSCGLIIDRTVVAMAAKADAAVAAVQ
jgi:hypothetical protein